MTFNEVVCPVDVILRVHVKQGMEALYDPGTLTRVGDGSVVVSYMGTRFDRKKKRWMPCRKEDTVKVAEIVSCRLLH